MGKLINGLFGGFHGRVGNLVGYTLKGKHIIRMIGKTEKPLTPARKANCEKMKVVNEILKPSIHAIRAGFRLAVVGTDKNEYNEAVSYNKKNALQGEYPNISLNYTKVLMSMGNLPVAVNPSISQNGTEVTFNWETSASPVSEYHTDRSMLVIYFPDIKETCCQLIGAKRVEGKDVIVIGPEHINKRMEAYITFIKDNGKQISDSVHAGSLNAVKTSLPDISTIEQTDDIKDAIPTSPVESGACEQYIIKDKATQKPIGNCALRYNQDNFQIVEIGINIFPTAQSKEAISTIMSCIFVRKE